MKMNPILLSAFILLLAASPSWAQHNHEHDDHDHSHAEHDHGDHDHHAHEAHGLQLAVEAIGSVAAGAPLTLDLRLTGPDGTAITADDLRVNHEHKLHVLIIDEGLDDFHHLHLDEDEDGVFQISFTPQHSRVYRVWVDTQLNEPLPEREGHDDHENHDHDHGGDHVHEHGGHDHDNHDHEGKETATAWIAVGEDAAPYIAPIEVLESEANGYHFTLAFDGHIHAGEPVLMRLSAIDPDGNPVLSYDSYLGAFAHLVGFNRGASVMLHAHPTGAQLTARTGRVLSFDVHIDEPGVHRLFTEVRIGDEKVVASFTVVAE